MMPVQKPGKSFQSYETPGDFMSAVQSRFGDIDFDLAASPDNAKSPNFFCEEQDSLKQDWPKVGNLWLNPPFSDIQPRAYKCEQHTKTPFRGKILMLVPASIGSNWFANHVHNRAFVFALSPRLTFKGCTAPYPKDCILACYSSGMTGFSTWRWK